MSPRIKAMYREMLIRRIDRINDILDAIADHSDSAFWQGVSERLEDEMSVLASKL